MRWVMGAVMRWGTQVKPRLFVAPIDASCSYACPDHMIRSHLTLLLLVLMVVSPSHTHILCTRMHTHVYACAHTPHTHMHMRTHMHSLCIGAASPSACSETLSSD